MGTFSLVEDQKPEWHFKEGGCLGFILRDPRTGLQRYGEGLWENGTHLTPLNASRQRDLKTGPENGTSMKRFFKTWLVFPFLKDLIFNILEES